MLDVRIRLRHLLCFLTIAQKHSVGRAAEALSITQPALSKTLRELEEVPGVRLFERDKKGMTLTRFGEILCITPPSASRRCAMGSITLD